MVQILAGNNLLNVALIPIVTPAEFLLSTVKLVYNGSDYPGTEVFNQVYTIVYWDTILIEGGTYLLWTWLLQEPYRSISTVELSPIYEEAWADQQGLNPSTGKAYLLNALVTAIANKLYPPT